MGPIKGCFLKGARRISSIWTCNDELVAASEVIKEDSSDAYTGSMSARLRAMVRKRLAEPLSLEKQKVAPSRPSLKYSIAIVCAIADFPTPA